MATDSPPIVLVLGDAGPLVEKTAAAVVADGVARCGIPAFNHARYRAGEQGLDAIATAQTPPMMSDLRLVELRDLHLAKPEELEALVDYAQSPSDLTLLLLVGSKLPASVKGQPNFGIRLKNAVKKTGQVIEHKAANVNVARFAIETAQAAGKKLSIQDANVLVEWLGTDLGRVRSEVEKLALFVGNVGTIHANDIRECSALLGEAEIWGLTGAIASKNVDGALATLHRLTAAGDDARRLLGMIAWQMREIVKLSELVAAGVPDAEIRKQGRVRFEVLRAVRTAGDKAPTAAATLSRLARANRSMNEHKAGDVRILEELVLELCR
jgi:DNA polymerase-3 subunit delta